LKKLNHTKIIEFINNLNFIKGGCELAINARTVNVVIVSHLSGAVGGLTWMFAEMIKHKKHKLSLNAFCSGAITGLVVITPAAGFVRPHYALIFGFLGIQFKHYIFV
jgi:Amt family ammonium transporter